MAYPSVHSEDLNIHFGVIKYLVNSSLSAAAKIKEGIIKDFSLEKIEWKMKYLKYLSRVLKHQSEV